MLQVKLISESVGQPAGLVRNAISKAMALGLWILIRNMHLDLACCRDEITKAFQVESPTSPVCHATSPLFLDATAPG
jgi:hypothetical protein